MSIDEKSAEKAKALSPKVTAALVDALSPLVSRGAIVAVSATALVALDDNEAVPVVVMLGITPETVAALMQALRGFALGAPMLEQSTFPVTAPAKQ